MNTAIRAHIHCIAHNYWYQKVQPFYTESELKGSNHYIIWFGIPWWKHTIWNNHEWSTDITMWTGFLSLYYQGQGQGQGPGRRKISEVKKRPVKNTIANAGSYHTYHKRTQKTLKAHWTAKTQRNCAKTEDIELKGERQITPFWGIPTPQDSNLFDISYQT